MRTRLRAWLPASADDPLPLALIDGRALPADGGWLEAVEPSAPHLPFGLGALDADGLLLRPGPALWEVEGEHLLAAAEGILLFERLRLTRRLVWSAYDAHRLTVAMARSVLPYVAEPGRGRLAVVLELAERYLAGQADATELQAGREIALRLAATPRMSGLALDPRDGSAKAAARAVAMLAAAASAGGLASPRRAVDFPYSDAASWAISATAAAADWAAGRDAPVRERISELAHRRYRRQLLAELRRLNRSERPARRDLRTTGG